MSEFIPGDWSRDASIYRKTTLNLVAQCVHDARLLYGSDVWKPEVLKMAEMLLMVRLKDPDFINALSKEYDPIDYEFIEL